MNSLIFVVTPEHLEVVSGITSAEKNVTRLYSEQLYCKTNHFEDQHMA